MGYVMPVYLFIDSSAYDNIEHPNIALINEWWFERNNAPFKRIDQDRSNYGGSKNMCEQAYVGVFTGYNRPEDFVCFLFELDWDDYDVVQVLAKGEASENQEFDLYNISCLE